MAYVTDISIVVLSLMVVYTSQAAIPLEITTGDQLKDTNILAAIVGLDSTTKMFGNTYRQAVLLYKDHEDELAALKELPDLVQRLKNELEVLEKRNKEVCVKSVQPMSQHGYSEVEILARQLNIKDMVEKYDRTKDWRALRTGLESVLDPVSAAYKQLQMISWSEQYAPWQIAYEGHTELVKVLVFLGRGINMTDGSQDNMLHGAVAGGQKHLVEMLLDNGADIESRNSWGNSPMVLACSYRRFPVAQLLWKRGADIDAASYDVKWTGLHRAVYNNDQEIVKFMVRIGASTTIKDKEGRTPYDLAKSKGFTEVAELLSRFPH